MNLINISYKDTKVFISSHKVAWHPILIDVLVWIHEHFNDLGRVIITESWRPKRHKNDLHGFDLLRAFDLRSWEFKIPDRVEAEINRNWQYDPARPTKMVCFYHDSGEGKHFHIQVHKNTRLRI